MAKGKDAVFIASNPFLNEQGSMTKDELKLCLKYLDNIAAYFSKYDIMAHKGAIDEAFSLVSTLEKNPDIWATPEARFEAMKSVRRLYYSLSYIYVQTREGWAIEA
jgi:hypothetical protein